MDEPSQFQRATQEIGLALTVMHDPLDVARVVADHIQDLLSTDAVAIFTWDEPAQRLLMMYSTRPWSGLMGVRSGQVAVGQALEQRRPILVNEGASCSHAPAADVQPEREVLAAVPLLVAGAAVGVLSAARTDKRPFTPADVDLLATVGALSLAPAIEMDRLRGRVRELELRMAFLQTRANTDELKRRLQPGYAPGQSEASTGIAIPHLSRRESETLPFLAQGYTNREIGAALGLSPGTVRNTVARLLMKLHARDRTHAVAIALARGLLDPISD